MSCVDDDGYPDYTDCFAGLVALGNLFFLKGWLGALAKFSCFSLKSLVIHVIAWRILVFGRDFFFLNSCIGSGLMYNMYFSFELMN